MRISFYILLSVALITYSCSNSDNTIEGELQSYQELKSIQVDTLLINTSLGIKENFHIVDGEHLVFHYHEDNEDEIDLSSCFDCATSLDIYFQINPNLSSFHLKDESLIQSNAHFENLFGIGIFRDRVQSGEIIGNKTSQSSWKVEFKIKVGFDSYEIRRATYILD